MCPLCLGNLIGDEKHYIFHCTKERFCEGKIVKELSDSNLQSCFNDAAFTELTRMILNGTFQLSCHMKLDRIGKFLSATLERTDVLLRKIK